MPSAFPEGQSILTEVFDGHPQKQLSSVWRYLSDGDRARIPKGIVSSTMELIPIDEPIIYRNFIEGVSPRGIGIGYPERINLAFDADKIALALIWQGAFIDAKRHWSGRGQGFQPPEGDLILPLPKAVPFAVLGEDAKEWPNQLPGEQGFRFKGYSLDKARRPHFNYTWNTINVEDFPEPVSGEKYPFLRRTLTLKSPEGLSKNVFHQIAQGAKIEKKEKGWLIDNSLTVQAEKAHLSSLIVRKLGSKQVLLYQLPEGKTETTVRYEFHW